MSAATPKEVVYLDIDDDITSIIDKVESAGSKVVALVLPKRAAALQSIVNMRLLARSAETAGKKAVLITTEAALLPLAGAAGLNVAKSLQSTPEVPSSPVPPVPTKHAVEAEAVPEAAGDEADLPKKIDYSRSVGELAAKDEHLETIELDSDEEAAAASALDEPAKKPKAPKDKKLAVPNFDRFRLMLGLAIAGVLALIIFIILAIWVLPKATIAITTTSVPVSTNFALNTSDTAKALDEKAGVIPASLKTSDQTTNQQVQATGQQNNGTKATGSIVMSTSDCSGTAPTVAAGTGVSSAGSTFITQNQATFTPKLDSHNNCYYSSNSTNVTAQQGGSKNNLAAGSSFTVYGYPAVTGSNSSAFSGGTDNITTVVSQNDVDNAAKKITSSDTDTFTKAFESQLSSAGFYVITPTLKLSDPVTTATPAVGQPASSVTVNIKITYTVLVVKKADLQKAITDKLTSQIGTKQKLSNSDNVLNGASVTVTNQSSPIIAQLAISEDTIAVPQLDITSIKKEVAGQKSGDIQAALGGIDGVKNVDVHLSPFWVSKVPKSLSKIHIVQQQVKS